MRMCDPWGRKLFVHYKQDMPLCPAGPLGICKQGEKAEGFFSPAKKKQACCGRPSESAVDREVHGFCAAEFTFIVTDGANEKASGKPYIQSVLDNISTKTASMHFDELCARRH